MKKYLALILSLVLMITMLVSCGGGEETGESEEGVQVGIVLPTKDETRWIQDEISLETALQNAGLTCRILFSQNTTTTELSNVEELIEDGAKVLVICSPNPADAGKAVQEAKDANVTVISYDRLITGTDAVDYYITFDSYAAGVAQGQYLIDKFAGKKEVPLYMFGGKRDDDNAYLLFAGAWSVLSKAVESGQFEVQNCPAVEEYAGKALDAAKDREDLTKILGTIDTGWDADTADKFAQDSLAAGKKGDVAILAPNDDTSRAIADVFAEDEEIKSYVITGMDADLPSLKYIQDGKQSMTVRKNVEELATATCDAVSKILAGETPETTTESDNGAKKVPTIGIDVSVVDAAGLKDLIADGTYKQEDIDNAE